MSKKDRMVHLNIRELKEFLRHMISNNQYLQKDGKVPVAINIEGLAGIGKTSAAQQLAQELEMECVKLNLAQMDELGDLVGFPVKEFEISKLDGTTGDTITKWVPESQINEYTIDGFKATGEKRMSHAVPQWIQGKKDGGILILDDYTRADHRFTQATMELN